MLSFGKNITITNSYTMNRTFFVFLLAIGLFACSTRTNTEPFTTAVLPTQEFLIANNRDTVLKTVHGTKISIKANSFATEAKVNIVIKEALTAFEIFAAGLTTESNGRPLRSGGMIFIDARAGGKQPEILQPINISIPNSSWDSEMQLFKGEEAADGSINWVEPAVLNETAQSQQLLLGKTLFESKCRTCHSSIFNDMIAPPLMGIDERVPDRKRIHRWVNDNAKVIREGKDLYFLNRYKYSPTTMDLFPALEASAIDAIIDYVNNEVKLNQNNLPVNTGDIVKTTDTSSNTGAFADSCLKQDTVITPLKKNEISFIATGTYKVPSRNNIITPVENTGTMVFDTFPENTNTGIYDTIPENSMQQPVPVTDAYEFNIDAFGWYNIDAFMNEAENMIDVQLTAAIKGYDEKDIKVLLFCPDKKLQLNFTHTNDNLYQFSKNDGDLKLFKNDRAILFACIKKEDIYYYGISEFRITEKQQITINIQKGNFDAIKAMLTTRKIDGIEIQVEKPGIKIITGPCDSIPARLPAASIVRDTI